MALNQAIPQPPNNPISDDPVRDAIYRRWFEELFGFAGQLTNVHNDLDGLQGGLGTTEFYHLSAAQYNTVTSFGTFTNNRVLVTGPTSSITTSDDLQYSIATSTLTTNNVSTLGTLTAGNSSSDAFNVNAGTGNIPNGLVWNRTFTGISGAPVAFTVENTTQHLTSSAATIIGALYSVTHDSGQSITSLRGSFGRIQNTASGTGAAGTVEVITARLDWNGTGAISNGAGFATLITLDAAAPITTLRGYFHPLVGNSGAASVTTHVGVDIADQSVGITIAAFRGQISAGTGKWNVLCSGTANNAFNGNVRIGSNVAPTVALDVTGFGIYTGNVSAAAFIPTSSAVPMAGMYLSATNEVSWSTNSTKALTLTSTRSLYGTALHNNAGAITGTTNQYIASGTYTPTVSSIANLDSTTTFAAQFIRVGNVVMVSGKTTVDPTLTATLTRLGISLPVASNLGAEEDCAGSAFASGIAGQGAAIRANATDDTAEMVWISGDITAQPMYWNFQYEVL